MLENLTQSMIEWNNMLGTWAVSRAAGITAFLFFGISSIAGMLSAMKSLLPKTRGTWNVLHQWTGWFGWMMTLLHLLAIWMDTYTEFTLVELFIPFTSDEDRIANGLGTIGFYAFAGIMISSDWFRRSFPKAWKVIHISAFPAFFLLLAHSLWAGTDSRKWVVTGVYMAISILFIILAWWRQKPEDPMMKPAASGPQSALETAERLPVRLTK